MITWRGSSRDSITMNIWTASCKDRTAVRDNALMDLTLLIEIARGSTLVCLQVGERRPVFRPQTS